MNAHGKPIPNANITAARQKGLAKQDARQKEHAGSGPRAFGMATGFSRADGINAERVLADPDNQRDPKGRLLAGLWLDHERNAGVISDQDFIESLDDLGVDPNVTDNSPDGRTGLQSLVDDYNASNPDRKATVPSASWVEWENEDGSRTGYTADVVTGKKGKAFVKARVHDVRQNEDGTWSREEKKAALGGELTGGDKNAPDFPSPDQLNDALEGKFDGEPNKVNASAGGKKFSFTKGDDEGIYDVSVTDENGNEVYSGEHDTSDTPSLAADLYESATGEEYTEDLGDGETIAEIPDVDDEGNLIEPDPATNAKPEPGAPEETDQPVDGITPVGQEDGTAQKPPARPGSRPHPREAVRHPPSHPVDTRQTVQPRHTTHTRSWYSLSTRRCTKRVRPSSRRYRMSVHRPPAWKVTTGTN